MDLSSFYKQAVPVNARTFLDTIFGNRDPITEKDFTKEELDTLKTSIANRQRSNILREEAIQQDLRMSPQEYQKNPQAYWDDSFQRKEIAYDEFMRQKMREQDSFNRTRDRVSFGYGDYPIKSGEFAAPVVQNWLSAILQSYTDPGFRLAATLGSAKYQNGAVLDSYGFSDDHPTYPVKANAPLWDILKQYGDAPGSLGEILFSKYLGNVRRPVKIQLD